MQAIEREAECFAPHRIVGQIELQHTCGLNAAEIDELVDYGALVPHSMPREGARSFGAECSCAT